jgi:nicotinamidase-related amidase
MPIHPFEDHCWQDVVPADVLDLYKHYRRELYVGERAAVVTIDLYELAYQGGPLPVMEVAKTYPSSCGEHAWNAIEPSVKVLKAARAAGLPIFHTTGEGRPDAHAIKVRGTLRNGQAFTEEAFAIRPEFLAPGDTVVRKVRASGFYGTPLAAHLTQLGVTSIIMFGESTSGCLRASAVDGYSHGFHMTVVEECCYDRSLISHKINLFDLHHKYADVMHADEVIAHLDARAAVAR